MSKNQTPLPLSSWKHSGVMVPIVGRKYYPLRMVQTYSKHCPFCPGHKILRVHIALLLFFLVPRNLDSGNSFIFIGTDGARFMGGTRNGHTRNPGSRWYASTFHQVTTCVQGEIKFIASLMRCRSCDEHLIWQVHLFWHFLWFESRWPQRRSETKD